MSPFASYFHELRVNSGFKQIELAVLMGYEQTYISAIEKDRKGPPNEDFIQRFIEVLDLNEDQSKNLFHCAKASNRKLQLGSENCIEAFWLVNDLRERLAKLSNAQISAIRSIIAIQDVKSQSQSLKVLPMNSTERQEAIM